MSMQLELWQLISLLLAFFSGVAGFGRIMLGQIERRLDERFAAQDQAREAGARSLRELIRSYTDQVESNGRQVQQLERDFLEWKAEIPVQYVRREDYIRGQAVLEAKLDALYSKLEVVQMKGGRHD